MSASEPGGLSQEHLLPQFVDTEKRRSETSPLSASSFIVGRELDDARWTLMVTVHPGVASEAASGPPPPTTPASKDEDEPGVMRISTNPP